MERQANQMSIAAATFLVAYLAIPWAGFALTQALDPKPQAAAGFGLGYSFLLLFLLFALPAHVAALALLRRVAPRAFGRLSPPLIASLSAACALAQLYLPSGADAFHRALPSWAYDGVDAIMMTVFAALRPAIVTASVFGAAIAVTRSRSQSAPAPGT